MAPQLTVLSLGSNLGDRFENIQQMISGLRGVLEPEFTQSRLMETEPVAVFEKQNWYLNLIVCGRYNNNVQVLLDACHEIENRLGRTRVSQKAARTADIDILLFGDEISKEETILLPHPGVLTRRFCLEGMVELLPDRLVPGTGLSVQKLFETMPDTVRCQQIRFPK